MIDTVKIAVRALKTSLSALSAAYRLDREHLAIKQRLDRLERLAARDEAEEVDSFIRRVS